MSARTKRPNAVDRTMHAPVLDGGVWVRYGDWYDRVKATGMPVSFLNDLSAQKTGEMEARQAGSDWVCPDCDHPLALSQPWCECGAEIDWTPAGLVMVQLPALDCFRDDFGADAIPTTWQPAERGER